MIQANTLEAATVIAQKLAEIMKTTTPQEATK